jgi:hypothetical protein
MLLLSCSSKDEEVLDDRHLSQTLVITKQLDRLAPVLFISTASAPFN